jgi:hypothetical protein
MNGLSQEQKYLIALARAWARGAPGHVSPPNGLDRERFQHMIANLYAIPTLAARIDPRALPLQTQTQHTMAMEVARKRTTIMLLELERILPALAEQGCRPVVLKGASLALTVYPQPEDRWFMDLDLLVDPSELAGTYAVLERLGYRFADTGHPASLYDNHHFHRIMISRQGICIEVHWSITMPASVYTHDLAALREGCVEIPLGAAGFLAPGSVDQILHGTLQSVAGGFTDLRRMFDLHLLDALIDQHDHQTLCARAWDGNLATGLWLQYRLRELILEEPIPRIIDESCRPAPRLARLFDQIEVAKPSLGSDGERPEGYNYLLHCLCVPPSYRTREAWRFLFPDQWGMFEAGLGKTGNVSMRQRARLHLSRLRASTRLLGWLARTRLKPSFVSSS